MLRRLVRSSRRIRPHGLGHPRCQHWGLARRPRPPPICHRRRSDLDLRSGLARSRGRRCERSRARQGPTSRREGPDHEERGRLRAVPGDCRDAGVWRRAVEMARRSHGAMQGGIFREARAARCREPRISKPRRRSKASKCKRAIL